jgi:hypothetical protein
MIPNTWQRVMGSIDVKRFWIRCKMRLKILPKPPRNLKKRKEIRMELSSDLVSTR